MPPPFTGRDRELAFLSDQLRQVRRTGHGVLLSVRGRRRIGKSRLLEEFLRREGVGSVFFVATRQQPGDELAEFVNLVVRAPGVDERARERLEEARPRTWASALDLASQGASKRRPLVVVIDELPYLAADYRTVEATLQAAWDRDLQARPVMLVLIGSDVGMMEALTSHDRPLFGRARELVVPPLDPAAVGRLAGLGPAAALDAYLVIGGFPQLASTWSPGEDMWAYLAASLDDPTAPLIVNAERSLRAEFPAGGRAQDVLMAIGTGERAFSAIRTRASVNEQTLTVTLGALQEKRVVERRLPLAGGGPGGGPRYVVADPYLRFWLRFVSPNLELVERGRGEYVLERIRAGWEAYRGQAIEPVVRAAIERVLPDERFGDARFVGGYWTRDGRVEVDLTGTAHPESARNTQVAFVGSIKWASQPFGREAFAALVAHRQGVPGAGPETLLVGVSRGGYETPGLDMALGPADIMAVRGEDERRSR